ncbi:MAG: lipopolysaccharide kinase InaA family protein [Pirellulales bacterium]
MHEFCWIDPTARELVTSHGLADLPAVLARWEGERSAGDRRGRDTLRVELSDEQGRAKQVSLKRERTVRIKDLLSQRLSSGGYRTKARWELEVSWCLASAGIGCPRPLVCMEAGNWPALGCLALEEAADSLPLATYLAGQLSEWETAQREQFFMQLGREVGRLHATGFSHSDLYADRVQVTPVGAHWKISFRDFEHAVRHSRVPLSRRADDLAALVATLSRRVASPRDRELLFDGYLVQSELVDRGIEFLADVERRVELLLKQRRVWEIRESGAAEQLSQRQWESLEAGKMWIDREFRAALDQGGLSQFESMMATTSGRLLRALPDRENWRLELHAPHGSARGAYLKKHHIRTWQSWWRAKVGAGPGKSPGRVEARNAARLARSGIAAMRLIAYGEKLHPDGLLESFVLTEELAEYTQLDHFLRQRFPARQADETTPRDPALDQLLRDVAAVAARFHQLGYNHRDLYCCHFFIKEPQPGEFKVNLIDLQRVEHRPRFRWRWLVKDLAQLSYSAPRDRISCTQKMAFIKRYLGVKKLRPRDKKLIRRVLAKQRWMEWHLGAHP